MKNIFFAIIFTCLLFGPVFQASGQSSSSSSETSGNFDTKEFPQWAKDLRRWDIIAFGSYPFAMFTVSFITDMVRWKKENDMDFSSDGRKYAPWPFKSAGAVEWTKEEFEKVIWQAAVVSAAIAVIDLVIVLIKRNIERRRIESRARGTITVNKIQEEIEEKDILDIIEEIEENEVEEPDIEVGDAAESETE